ncbi:MAG: hypothetical protein A4E48_02313 [Methanosaeta sp. PtaU1.Bin060]|nr:MAG: hypothetical protein A4E48_02313 [Methanosaeta sp. PtaU1.Bin060]
MRWPWQKARLVEPRPMAGRAQELETAKKILAEIFGARPDEVEEMIQRRLEGSVPFEREEGC